jgi:hypothetical protein
VRAGEVLTASRPPPSQRSHSQASPAPLPQDEPPDSPTAH